jgi:hypothetical protein
MVKTQLSADEGCPFFHDRHPATLIGINILEASG